MRKTCSLVVSIALAISLACAVPVGAFADEEASSTSQEGAGNGFSLVDEGSEPGSEDSSSGQDPLLLTDSGIDPATDGEQDGENISVGDVAPPVLSYRAHVSNVGWQNYVNSGELSGTTGCSYAIEALQVAFDPSYDGSIYVSSFVEGQSWQDWVTDGSASGTTGKSLSIEAVKIKLDDALSESYDVYYRVHASNLGWLDWTKNGMPAGTNGYGYAIEAIEIVLVKAGEAAPGEVSDAAYRAPLVSYAAHVSNIGWQGKVWDGQVTGSVGASRAMEALVVDVPAGADREELTYCAHVANIGWQDWVTGGSVSGTTGKSLQMEAVKIDLTGSLAQQYDVYYRAHVANLGWLDWACNGEAAGSEAAGFRLEALQICFVEKGSSAPGDTAVPFVSEVSVAYSAHIQNIGWQDSVFDGALAGTSGMSLRVESFRADIAASEVSGGLRYRAHVQNIGWQDWVADGLPAGTEGSSLRMEAISVELTGDLAKYYDVFYRVHAENYGWLGWAKNGQDAGTSKCSYRLEGVQIIVKAKGSAAPGSTSGFFKDTPYESSRAKMDSRIANMSSPTGWLLAVDTQACRVGVYRGSAGNWQSEYFWLCSPGAWSSPTVKGVFKVGSRGYSFGSGYTCYYWTQFCGNYLFHSVLYNQGTRVIQDGTLGVPKSHGCVRLDINNAKWIYDNIPTRSTVYVY